MSRAPSLRSPMRASTCSPTASVRFWVWSPVVVLDPFSGTATTGLAARQLGCSYIGIDLDPTFHDLAIARFAAQEEVAL